MKLIVFESTINNYILKYLEAFLLTHWRKFSSLYRNGKVKEKSKI